MATVNGVPVECLSGELAGVWNGWKGLGDREIVREASAKGTHIDLAYKFLEIRRNCSTQEAKNYFNNSVEDWVNELLKKKQIHRASHILKNVSKIPVEYMRNYCLKCKEPDLRNYLAKNVESSFSIEEKEVWVMINFISKYEEKLKLKNNLISQMCLQDIINLPQSIKDSIFTEIYFTSYEPKIIANLKSNIVWDFLLANNKIEFIKLWVDLSFGESKNLVFPILEKGSDIQLLFTNLKIKNSMIDSVESSNGMLIFNNLIISYLSRYGIFTTKESNSAKSILFRFYENSIPPTNFQNILSKPYCNVNKKKFFSKVDVVSFSRNYDEINELDTLDLKSKRLYDSTKNMCSTINNYKEFLELAIIETIKYLIRDTNQYFMQNPIIAFALIFLNCFNDQQDLNKLSLKQILNINKELTFKNWNLSKNLLDTVIFSLPYLKNELATKQIKNLINMYQLLDGYINLNSTLFFKWRFKNGKMPDFSSENLVKKFGHKEKLSYINYLKEARPNMAINILIQESSISGILCKTKSQVSLCAHVFALRHSKEVDIVGGCISFLEILGISSENLRLHITAAQLVQKELNVSIESSLELIIYNNQQELKLVLNYLERSFHPWLNIKTIEDYEEFTQALHIWTIIVKFAKAHNASLPTSLPRFLASQNFWFQFILVGHLFSYPLNQLLECMQNFENSSLIEHLLCLNNTQLLKKNSIENIKKSKIEKKRERKNSLQVTQDENYVKSGSSSQELTLSNRDTATRDFSTKTNNTYANSNTNTTSHVDDLWLIILKCQQSQDPAGSLLKLSRIFKSPILIVLATCFEPSPVSSYCYSWLVISIENKNFMTEYEGCLEKQIWTARTVLNLFQNMVARGFVGTLYRGLHIFLPENPLKSFFEFLSQCIECGNFNNCEKLLNFITECSSYKCNKIIDWDCDDATYLENLYWIQMVAVKSIIVTLGKTLQSTHTQLEFLEILVKIDFQEKLIVDAPNFETLLEYIQILSETVAKLDFFSFDMTEKIYEAEAEIEKCINELIKVEDYSNALRLTKVANFEASKIILAQYRSEFKKNADKDGVVDSRFWSRCAFDFEKFNVCYEKAAEFFIEHAEKVKSYKERYEILKLALKILDKNSTDRQICDTVEMAMWKSCILAGPESIEIKSKNIVFKKLKTELLSCVSELRVTCSFNEVDEKKAVENLIGRLLDAGRLDTALRISAIFNHRNKDLQVLMLCLSLAEGEISPYQLTVQQRALLSDSNKPRERNSTLRSIELKRLPSVTPINLSLSTLSNSLESTNATHVVEQHEQADRLSLLTNLIEILGHGVDIGIKILLYYQLSVQIGKSYQVLLTLNNPLNFLKEIVRSPYDRKLELARDIITIYQIENQEVANFLSEEIVAHITQVIEDGLNDCSAAWNYNLNLQSVIDLCKDSSLLGLKLLDMANKLLGHSNGEKRNLVTLKIIVELLIRSHDCFTASCNMEGIASVLRKCQQLANSLQNLKHWSLLVRLITGVGRFTEMNYIFKILKENDQFEFLLGRGLDKVPGFRMALLDFLKRHCPEDKDLQNIVALHFRLYYEIAIIWKNEAQDVINDLIREAKKECGRTVYNPLVEIKFTRNDSTEKKLQLALTNFTHATQYFLQDNKLNLANRCSHQAQLVALQISLLNSTSQSQIPIILNLSSDEINQAISCYLNFSQALIVARAYDHHVDWANAIYSHCILNGENKYFKDFITSKRLTTSVAIDCGRRYRLEKNITKSMKENMQILVESLNDNECKYVLASQMGFRKIIEEMLDNPAVGAYLKDTVFKRKYMAAEASTESFSKG